MMTDYERLAIAQAVWKALGTLVSTEDEDSLRSTCDRRLLDAYVEDGTDRVQLRVGGAKVGTLSVVMTKPVRKSVLEVTDRRAFEAWALENGYAHEETRIVVDDEQDTLSSLVTDGVMPDGCEWREVDEPARVKGTTIRGCNPQDVADALGDALPGAVMGLLTGGDEA